MFEILEAPKIIEGEARITLLPKGNGVLAELLATAPAWASRKQADPDLGGASQLLRS